MKTNDPKIEKKTFKTEYWTCGFVEHRHAKKETAERCVLKNKTKHHAKLNQEKYLIILRMRWDGFSYSKISKYVGLSRNRVRLICKELTSRANDPRWIEGNPLGRNPVSFAGKHYEIDDDLARKIRENPVI